MSILLTHGYFLDEDELEKKIMMPYPPLGLLYISSYLDSKKIEHKVFDSTFSNEKEWLKNVKINNYKIIAFYCTLMTKTKILKLIKIIKNNVGFNDVKVLLGGPDVTYNIENYFKHGADFIIKGEGEKTFSEFIFEFFGEKQFQKVDGLVYLNKQKEIINNKAQQLIDINQIPAPNRSKVNINQYIEVWTTVHGKSSLNISTQRGCPYACKWCSKSVYGKTYRRINPTRVVNEIESLIKEYKPDNLWFTDDVFTIDHKWIKSFVEELQRKKISVPFECITRAEKLNDSILGLLKSVGCYRIWIGAESGSQKVIDLMHRQVNIKKVKEMMLLTKKHGIETGTFIMVGYPKETKKDIKKTIRYLKAINPDHVTVTKTYPIKGTDLYNEVKEEIIYQPQWLSGTDRQIVFKRTYSEKFYDLAVRKILNEVNYQKLKNKGRSISANSIKYKVKSIILSGLMWIKK